MAKLKSILAGVAALGMMASTSIAFAAKPAACPSVTDIKENGLFRVYQSDEEKLYYVWQMSDYNTPEQWTFAIGVPFEQATSTSDAQVKAEAALVTINGEPKPKPHKDIWYCMYKNDYQYFTIAYTAMNPTSFMGELHRKAVSNKQK